MTLFQLNDTVWEAIHMMGKGMLGIFVVIGLIALVVVVLSRLTNSKNK